VPFLVCRGETTAERRKGRRNNGYSNLDPPHLSAAFLPSAPIQYLPAKQTLVSPAAWAASKWALDHWTALHLTPVQPSVAASSNGPKSSSWSLRFSSLGDPPNPSKLQKCHTTLRISCPDIHAKFLTYASCAAGLTCQAVQAFSPLAPSPTPG